MNKKKKRAKELRYKKPMLKDLNYEYMCEKLYEIIEKCDEVQYFEDTDDETLLEALDGDEDEAWEFRMMFSSLSADCERFAEDLKEYGVSEHFDDFCVFGSCGDDFGGLVGYDSYECDYFGIEPEMWAWCSDDTRKKLERLTKIEILETARNCFKVLTAYLSVCNRYEDLRDSIDILRDKNLKYLDTIKEIDKLYYIAECDNFYEYSNSTKEFDKLIKLLPDDVWIQC